MLLFQVGENWVSKRNKSENGLQRTKDSSETMKKRYYSSLLSGMNLHYLQRENWFLAHFSVNIKATVPLLLYKEKEMDFWAKQGDKCFSDVSKYFKSYKVRHLCLYFQYFILFGCKQTWINTKIKQKSRAKQIEKYFADIRKYFKSSIDTVPLLLYEGKEMDFRAKQIGKWFSFIRKYFKSYKFTHLCPYFQHFIPFGCKLI